MQVGPHIHDIKMDFKLELAPGKTLERFVYLWQIYAGQVYLIDSGVSGSRDLTLNSVRTNGYDTSLIAALIITHAHPDHIGGAPGVQKATGCIVAAHEADKAWIEDTELQYQQRPVPGFHSIVEGPVKVDRPLQDNDIIELKDGSTLKVIHTPGHAKGQIALLHDADKALFCGDAIPLRGEMPIYDDVLASIASIRKLQEIKGLKLLLSSWDVPRQGRQIYEVMDGALAYIQDIHRAVVQAKTELNVTEAPAIAKQVIHSLRLPPTAFNPLFVKTIEAHLRLSDHQNLPAL